MKSSELDKNLCFASAAFYRLTNKIALQEMAVTGLSPSYAFLIVAVKKSPGIRMTELSQQLYLEASTVTRLIEKLETKKYVIRDSLPGITRVYLTDFGDKVYNNVILALDRYLAQIKNTFGKKASRELTKSMVAAIAIMEEGTKDH